MADQINEGAYRISGRFGEGFYLDPSGKRPPIKIIEATQIEFTLALGVIDVPLAGNRTGSKDGAETRTGVMAIQQIDAFFENIVLEARSSNLDARRAARDAGHRLTRTFTLQVWQDGRQRASDEKTGEINTFVWASWNVARVLLEPKLGPTIQRLQTAAKASEDGKIDGQGGKRVDPPADAAHLLRRMFGRQSGALLELSAKVLELSKLQSDSNSVREIEAAKN
jgi:hypothetical protein